MIIAKVCVVNNYFKKYFIRKNMYDALSKKHNDINKELFSR